MIMTMHLRLSMKIQLLDQNVSEFDMQAESGRLIVGLSYLMKLEIPS